MRGRPGVVGRAWWGGGEILSILAVDTRTERGQNYGLS